MSKGVPAGRLQIEIVAELARLQNDMDRARRMVGAAASDMAGYASAANRSLATIGGGAASANNELMRLFATQKSMAAGINAVTGVSAGAFRRDAADIMAYGNAMDGLRAKYNPLFAVIRQYKAEAESVRKAHAVGAISAEEMGTALSRLRQESLASIAAMKGQSSAMSKSAVSAGAHRHAMMGASYQVQDFLTQVSMGANPINAFAVQGAQLAGQFANVGGKAGAVASFFMGPWGMAITGAVLVTGMLTKGLFDGAEAAKAKEKAAKELVQQMDNLYDANMRAIKSEQWLQRETLKTSEEMWNKAEKIRLVTVETIKNAQAQLKVLQTQMSHQSTVPVGEFGAAASAGTAAMIGLRAREMKELNELLKENEKSVKKTRESFQAAKIPIMMDKIRAETDAALASTLRYNDALDKVKALAISGSINDDEAERRARSLHHTYEAEQKTIAESEKANSRSDRSAERRAESIQREVDSLQQKITNLYDLADALGVSDAAAMRADAAGKAREKAIRKQADLEKFVGDELKRTVAERAVAAARSAADMNHQSALQQQVNAAVRAGTLDVDSMGEALSDLAAQRDILAALDVATALGDVNAIARIEAALAKLTEAQARNNKVRRAAQDIQRADALRREIADIQAMTLATEKLGAARIGILLNTKSGFDQEQQLARENAQHEKQLLLIRAKAEAEVARGQGQYETAIAIMDKMRAEQAKIDQALGFEDAEQAIRRLRDAADGLDFAGIFGRGGEAVREMIQSMGDLRDAQAAHKVLVLAAGGDQAKIAKADALYRNAQIAGNMKMLSGTKTLFKEKSAGYKAITTVEKAYAIWEMANTLKSMALGKVETAQELTNAGVKAGANQAAGASKIFSQLGMWAFPVVGAMIAVLASLGMKGGGGGTGAIPPTPEDLQAAFGTGTVHGDASAQSASLARSLELIAANTNSDLEYSNQSLRILREINSGIGTLAGKLGQQIGMGAAGMFDTSGLSIGSSGKGGIFGIGGKSTTRDLYDQGLQIYAQGVDKILAGHFQAQVYNTVQQITKKKGFLGIGGGTKTRYSTSYSGINGDIQTAFADMVRNVTDGVVGIMATYSTTMSANLRDLILHMQLPAITFSTKDMGLDDIEGALQAYFSSVADRVADQAAHQLPVLLELQRAGEGMFETLARVIKTYSSVNVGLSSIGMGGFGQSDAGLRGASQLTDLFGDLDTYQDGISKFRDKFLTEAEQMAPIIDAVRLEMSRLGLTSVTTNDQFKAMVLGLDLTSAAGREMFAQLMAVAPAFDKVTDYLGALDGAIGESAEAVRQRRNLEIQIMELQGRAADALAAKRQQELAALDEALRPMQLYIYALQDEAAAKANLKTAYERESRDITTVRDRFADLGKTLRDYRATLAPQANAANAYARAAAEFAATAGAARIGDADAMQRMSQVSQDFLGQSMSNARTQLDYLRDMARVQQAVDEAIGAADEAVDYQQAQLDALEAIVRIHIDLNENILSVVDAIHALEAAQLGMVGVGADVGNIPIVATIPAGANSENAALRAEIATLSEKLDRVAAGVERGAIAGERTNDKYLARVVENDAVRIRAAD